MTCMIAIGLVVIEWMIIISSKYVLENIPAVSTVEIISNWYNMTNEKDNSVDMLVDIAICLIWWKGWCSYLKILFDIKNLVIVLIALMLLWKASIEISHLKFRIPLRKCLLPQLIIIMVYSGVTSLVMIPYGLSNFITARRIINLCVSINIERNWLLKRCMLSFMYIYKFVRIVIRLPLLSHLLWGALWS